MKLNSKRFVMALLFSAITFLLLPSARANTPIFVYMNRDLLLCFRKTGADGGTTSPNDLEVNIGQAAIFYNAAPGSTITITQFSKSQLGAAFDNINDLSWSVGGCVPVGDTGDPSIPLKTLWVTAPRLDPSTPASPWVRNGPSTLGVTAGKMNTILANASFYSGTIPADPKNNTASVIAVPVGSNHEYGLYMGPLGNYDNTFQGNVENTTAANFVSGSNPARSDLYEIRPDSTATQPAGKYLGYFELRSDGAMVFVASSNGPTAPKLTVTVTHNVSNISFPSTVGVSYTLYYTNSAGLSSSTATWPFVSTSIVGNGSTESFQDSATDPNRFYRVLAH